MKYIKEYKNPDKKEDFSFFFKWINSKKKNWDNGIKNIILPFFDNMFLLFNEFDENYNDNYDPKEIFQLYKDYINEGFDILLKNIRLCEDPELLLSLYYHLDISLSLFKDSLLEMSKNIVNYNSIYKLGYECFNIANRIFTPGLSQNYYDKISTHKHIDDNRENSIEFFENLKKLYLDRVDLIEPEEIFNMVNINTKSLTDLNINPGDEVKYKRNDKIENIAIVSYHQEEKSDDTNVILVSKKTGQKFQIKNDKIIEIIPRHKSINQKVSDKLKSVKDDENKMKKINKFLYDILNENIENTEQMIDNLKIQTTDTREWLSDSNFKRINIQNFKEILRDVYQPHGHWGKNYPDNPNSPVGVIELPWESERWSVLNRINTNFTAFKTLINMINRVIIENSKITKPFDFKNNRFGSPEFYSEYERFIKYLYNHRNRIFQKLTPPSGSNIINEIIRIINNTMNKGDTTEVLVNKNLYRIFDDLNWSIKKGESGGFEDMIEGVDIIFKQNDQSKKRIQVKTINQRPVELSNGFLQLSGTGISRHYKVEYLAVVFNKKEVYMFEYNPDLIQLYSGDLLVHRSLLHKKIEI